VGGGSDPGIAAAEAVARLIGSVRFAQRLLGFALAAACVFPLTAHALNVERLEPAEVALHGSILAQLEPVVAAKKQDGTANVMTWEMLYAPLSPEQQTFLDAFRALKAASLGATSHYFGEAADPDLVPVGPQQIVRDGEVKPLDPQYLPRPVFEAYQRMMDAMERDLGQRLLVESGYRSPAYQLYLFLYYMPKHAMSVKETNRFVALPGHSEHGYPPRQAIDFINQRGINGEDRPEEFEALPEHGWLQQHAAEFGFVLSYPRNNAMNTAFEPWHWHYEGAGQ